MNNRQVRALFWYSYFSALAYAYYCLFNLWKE